ncbi:MAG TPA: hypothetical protein PLX89_09065, partial [Verrucomicrobiota bacterium]|nr:hypothetical protein [Verrucomicrobiota bacterium]
MMIEPLPTAEASSSEPLETPVPEPSSIPSPRLRELALAAIAALMPREASPRGSAEIAFLHRHLSALSRVGETWGQAMERALTQPAPEDESLIRLGRELGFGVIELFTVALAAAVEDDAMTGRALAHV